MASKRKKNGKSNGNRKPGWYEARPRPEQPAPEHSRAAIQGHRNAGRGIGGDRGHRGAPGSAEARAANRSGCSACGGSGRVVPIFYPGGDGTAPCPDCSKVSLTEQPVTGFCTICNQPIRGDDHDGHILNQHPEYVNEAKGCHIDDEIDYFADENLKETGKDTDVYTCSKCGTTTDDPRDHIEEKHSQEIEDAVDNHEDDEVRHLSETYIVTNKPQPPDDQDVALAQAIDRNEATGEPIRVKRIHYFPQTEQVMDVEYKEYADEEEYYDDVPDDPFTDPTKDVIMSGDDRYQYGSYGKNKWEVHDTKATSPDKVVVARVDDPEEAKMMTARMNSKKGAKTQVYDTGEKDEWGRRIYSSVDGRRTYKDVNLSGPPAIHSTTAAGEPNLPVNVEIIKKGR